MAGRLGADIMIVPESYNDDIDSVLLSGKPSSFYLPSNVMKDLEAVRNETGIELLSPQTFLATLNASCCAYPVQLVGIDYDSDFVVKAWQKDSPFKNLKDGEIITGWQVAGWPGDKLKFFGKNLTVAGRLEESGTGFDAMIFMNMNTIAMLAREAEYITGSPLSRDGSLISVVMLKLKAGYDSSVSAIEINRLLHGKGIKAVFSKKFIDTLSAGLEVLSFSVWCRLLLFWCACAVISGLIFALTFSERRKEYGTLRALGASRGHVVRMCLSEIFIAGVYGSFIGLILGGILIAGSSPVMKRAFNLPFMLPGISVLTASAFLSVLVSVFTAVISGSWPALRAGSSDIQDIMRGA